MAIHTSIGICTPIPLEESAIKGQMRLGRICPEWQRARNMLLPPVGCNIMEVCADGMEVGVARTGAVQKAIENGCRYLFFLDWDTIPPQDALCRLVYQLENHPEKDIAAGIYPSKTDPPWPLLWREWEEGVSWDWFLGEVLTERIVGVPMGCTLLRLSLFDRLPPCTPEAPWFKTVHDIIEENLVKLPARSTEDLYFCKQFEEELRGKILVDTGVQCDHIDPPTGKVYSLPDDCLPYRRARELVRTYKVILHVGCGPEGNGQQMPRLTDPENWREVRLDIDPSVKPDVVGSMTDMRSVQTESVEAIWCNHSLEHLAYHEVPLALAEFFRVLKPGGQVMVCVPDIEAVAAEVVKGNLETVLYESPAGPIRTIDILYGYHVFIANGSKYQCHRTAFSASSAKEKFSAAGFVDVRTTPGECWNLTIMAAKPLDK